MPPPLASSTRKRETRVRPGAGRVLGWLVARRAHHSPPGMGGRGLVPASGPGGWEACLCESVPWALGSLEAGG